MALRERRFGVEIECGIKVDRAGRDDYFYWDSYEEQHRKALAAIEASDLPSAWAQDIGCDGSGVEVRSPILQGAEGFRQLRLCMQVLKDAGGYVTGEDGLHIHHDAPEFVKDPKLVKRLCYSWFNNQDLIDRMVDESRVDYDCCYPFTQEVLDEFEEGDAVRDLADKTDRGALNIWSLTEHGTVEIRQHEGTLDFARAQAWIRFGQAFLDAVLKRRNAMPTAPSTGVLLKRVRTADSATKRIMERVERGR